MSQRRTTRRSFLKYTGVAALGGLPVGAQQAPPTTCSPELEARPPASSERALLLAPEALFRPTVSGCTVHWVPNGPVEARVSAGTSADRLTVLRELASDAATEIDVTGFAPFSDAYLQCQFRRSKDDRWLTSPVRRIRTGRSRGEEFRVALIADSHVYKAVRFEQHMRNLRQTLAHVLADQPDFVVFLGDEAGIYYLNDKPGEMSQRRAFERWQLWRESFAPLLAAVPSFLVLGNHEGEAGFYQAHALGAHTGYYQRWGTIARKRYLLNPLPGTYAEGGENEGWRGEPGSAATAGTAEGNCSPLQNYFAWTWGDALFVVLDVHRYTNVGGVTPATVDEWTLGPVQLAWLERVLAASTARWKCVLAHHLVGGWAWDLTGRRRNPRYVYGRGGARYLRVGEQARITELMQRTGARLFLYGHDHVFAHQQAESLHFVCCGRPTFLSRSWWSTPGWREAYGDVGARDPHDFYAALGYTRLTVSSERVLIEYVRTGTDAAQSENVTGAEGEVVYAHSVV
jgi:3',5'-cyclic AMP phosphodiesterase CpdA